MVLLLCFIIAASLAIAFVVTKASMPFLVPIVERLTNFEMSVRASFKLYSQRLNAFVTLIVLPYIVATQGGFVATWINALPEAYRIVAAPFAGLIAFAIVTWSRLYVQQPPQQ